MNQRYIVFADYNTVCCFSNGDNWEVLEAHGTDQLSYCTIDNVQREVLGLPIVSVGTIQTVIHG
jgi:hypothetical protein